MKFYLVTVEQALQETRNLRHLELIINEQLKQSHAVSGQYVIIHAQGHKDGFFALSNAPHAERWNLLIKSVSPLSEYLCNLKKGDKIQISQAQGNGYDLVSHQNKNILLCAVGSAIAPIRSAILWILTRRQQFKKISLYYGALNGKEFAYHHDFESWKNQGIDIIQTIAPNPDSTWHGRTGFVQDHLPDQMLDQDTIALVCGMKEMMEAVKKKLVALGLPTRNFLTNI